MISMIKNMFFNSTTHTITNDLHESEKEVPSLIDGLPDDIVETIFSKLCVPDRVRLMSVSKRWNATLSEKRVRAPVSEPPWMIFPLESDSKFHGVRLHSMDGSRMYRFEYPFIGNWCCCGSSRGWLLLAGHRGLEHNFFSIVLVLWNPISKEFRRLPSLLLLPFYADAVDVGRTAGYDKISSYIKSMHVFSIDTAVECAVAIIFSSPVLEPNDYPRLLLCMPGDDNWKVVEVADTVMMDILFHRGKLLVYRKPDETELEHAGETEMLIRKVGSTVNLGGRDVEVETVSIVYKKDQYRGRELSPPLGFSMQKSCEAVENLAESSTGEELYVVTANLDFYLHHNGSATQFMNSFMCCQTGGFEVRKIEGESLGKVDGIGQQEVFVGGLTGAICVEANPSYGIVADKIRFCTDHGDKILFVNPNLDIYHFAYPQNYVVYEEGEYCLREGRKRTNMVEEACINRSSLVGWFTPKLF